MICPHCSASLLRKQRSRRTCSKCRQAFALEPKENPLHLHDLRMRRLATALADPGRPGAPPLRYTVDQLRLAAERKILAAGPQTGCGWLLISGVVVLAMFPISWAVADVAGPVGVVLVIAVVVVGLVAGHRRSVRRARRPGEPISPAAFETLLRRWQEVYSAPPPGLLPPRSAVAVRPPGRPRAVLFCTDARTVDFLLAAGVGERHATVLVPPAPECPPAAVLAALRDDPGLPVLVLHDADVHGCLALPRLRAVLPPGTLLHDVGLSPRVGARSGPPVVRMPDAAALHELAVATGAPLDESERSWLAEGKTYPLAAVRPARLLEAVERATTRAVAQDAERGRAAAFGFLDWPGRVP